jgi:CheY-like chemotaxis protein
MSFSRKQTISAKPCELNELLTNFKNFLDRIVPEDIAFNLDCCTEPLPVFVDINQLEQALTNLVANARDAMPKGGRLTISTAVVERDAAYIRKQGYGQPGHYAQITVTDTGCGMDESTRMKIFEPFFTTKDIGKGTGLGLAIVYGIIKQNRGNISVISKENQGSTFLIDLPLSDRQSAVTPSPKRLESPARGEETILVVEDETDLRDMVAAILRQFGYQVILAVNGQEAVEKFQQQTQIDLVLMDVVMPVMNGKDAANLMRRHTPEVKILFISGYARDIILSRGDLGSEENLLTKPIKPDELLHHIRRILDHKV